MTVESDNLVGFYDDVALLLTYRYSLRKTTVKCVFNNPNVAIFKEIKGTKSIAPPTDVSLLHIKRILYYPTIYYKLFPFNVDTMISSEVHIREKVFTMPRQQELMLV